MLTDSNRNGQLSCIVLIVLKNHVYHVNVFCHVLTWLLPLLKRAGKLVLLVTPALLRRITDRAAYNKIVMLRYHRGLLWGGQFSLPSPHWL